MARQGNPRVTQGLIAVCALVYVAQIVPGSTVTERFDYVPVLTLADPYRLITSAFLHSPNLILHILFNMYALWLVGPHLESLLGRTRFLALYLLSAFGGSVGFLLLADPTDPNSWLRGAVGASGAVFGLFAAEFVILRRLGRDAGPIVVMIGINLVIGFLPNINVAWQAHLGGLVTGGLATAAIAYAPKAQRVAVQVAGLAAIAIALVVLIALKVAISPEGVFPT